MLLLCFGCSESEVDTFGGIYGIITDVETKEAVRGADVVLAPGNISSTTSTDGRYEFTSLEPGQYK